MKALTIVTFEQYGDHCASIHKAGCRAIKDDLRTHGGFTNAFTGTVQDALDGYIDDEFKEMGFTEQDVKVHACCKDA